MTVQFDYPEDREAHSAARVRALEALLIEKGVITDATVDKVLGYFETDMAPFNGAKIVARAWTDPEFAERLVKDTPAAIAELGFPVGMDGAEGEHMRPWPTPPACTTSSSARCAPASPGRCSASRRTGTRIRPSAPARPASPVSCWRRSAWTWTRPSNCGCGTAAGIPAGSSFHSGPAGTEGMTEEELAALVTTESMIGVAAVPAPAA